MKLSLLHRYTLVCFTALINCACSSDPEQNPDTSQSATTSATTSTTGGVGFCDPTPFMQRACNGIICHGEPGSPAKYNTDLLNTPAQALINKPANYNLVADPTKCPTASPELLINPSNPSASLVLSKMMGTHACGEQMPNSEELQVTQQDIDCMVSWVNGAITEAGLTVTGGGPASTTSTATTGSSTTGSVTTGSSTTGSSTTGSVTTGSSTTGSVTTGSSTTGSSTTGSVTTTSTSSTTGGPPPATWDTMRDTIVMSTIYCAGSDCHGGFPERLNLQDDEGLYMRLTTWTSELCGNKLVVDPGNPDGSAILDVLTTGCGTVTPGCMIGVECIPQMPVNCTPGFDCIAQDKIDAIRQWIADGAVGPQ